MKLLRPFFLILLLPLSTFAQEPSSERPWILSDKVIEFAVPMFIITMVLQALVTVMKIRSNQKLKEKILEKETNNENILRLFDESDKVIKLEPLKWVFIALGLAVSFFLIQSFSNKSPISDLSSLSIVFVSVSASFFAYYLVLNRKK